MADTIRAIVRSDLGYEVVPAMQQTVGVMTSQSVAPLDVEEAQVDREVVATICLTEKSGSAGMVVALFASEDDVASLAGGILGEDVGIDGGHSTHSVNC